MRDTGRGRHERRRHAGIEADLLEAARARRLTRSPIVIWSLFAASAVVSIVSLVQAETTAAAPTASHVVMLIVAVAAVVALVSAGTLALHGSRESRWDAPVTVGLGALLLGVGTFDAAITAAAAANGNGGSLSPVHYGLDALKWGGLCMVVGGLVWRSPVNWSRRVRVVIVSFIMVVPLTAATSWYSVERRAAPERAALLLMAFLLLAMAIQMLRRDVATPLFAGGTALGVGLALAVVLDVSSVESGDLASIAALGWLLIAGLLTAAWFDRQSSLRARDHHVQTERYLRLIEESREDVQRAADDRSLLRHNGGSTLLAIEGGLDVLARSVERGDVASYERLSRALAMEVARLRRMLVESGPSGSVMPTDVAGCVDATVHLARSRGQLIAVDVTPGLAVAAGSDSVAEILHNLLDNAALHAPGSLVAIEATQVGDDIRIVVEDDGPGVPRELVDTVFDHGVSRRPQPGSGLGLYSARALARQAGGDLQLLASTTGAVFVLTLPRPPAETPAPLRLVDLPAVRGHG